MKLSKNKNVVKKLKKLLLINLKSKNLIKFPLHIHILLVNNKAHYMMPSLKLQMILCREKNIPLLNNYLKKNNLL
jgi:hypothetical protein